MFYVLEGAVRTSSATELSPARVRSPIGALAVLGHMVLGCDRVQASPVDAVDRRGPSQPITELMVGGLLSNTYRAQFVADRIVGVAGLYFRS